MLQLILVLIWTPCTGMDEKKRNTLFLESPRQASLNSIKENLDQAKMFVPLWGLQTACATLRRRIVDKMHIQCNLLQDPTSSFTRHNFTENVSTVQNSLSYHNIAFPWIEVNSEIYDFMDYILTDYNSISKVFFENSKTQNEKSASSHLNLKKTSRAINTFCDFPN